MVRKNKRLSDNSPTAPEDIFATERRGGSTEIKHVQVVRKKSEREQLNTYVCEECRSFYDAMMPGKECSTIKCTHAPPENAQNSRHRAKWAPEPAPKGFWNLAFTPPEKTEV
jgi:splicing factor 4